MNTMNTILNMPDTAGILMEAGKRSPFFSAFSHHFLLRSKWPAKSGVPPVSMTYFC